MLGGMRILPALLALLAAAPASAAERRFSVTDFDRVIIEGPYVVHLVTGRPTAAVARGSQQALDRVTLDTSGQTLRIRRNRNYWGGNPGGQEGPITIELATRTLRSAQLIGPANLDIDRVQGLRVELGVQGSGRLRATNVAADNLSLGLFGSGSLQLSGTAEAVTGSFEGTGDFDGSQLRAETANLTLNTVGNVSLVVNREATVNAYGTGQAVISGRAACTLRGPAADQVRCGRLGSNQR